MPDPSHVGRRYAAPAQLISPERVAAYAAAVGGDDPTFSPGSVPPVFAAVYCVQPTLARMFADPELGIELAGLIHAEQSFEWPQPLRPGDLVDAAAVVTSVEARRGLTFITLELEATNQSGETVCRGRTLLLTRGAAR